ncbi:MULTISPECIES: class II fumarate hydratase [Kordiimonas]|jgi:fumarate hydratase class II|uniref:class II fumarate hydratase n=1 Tax=Kordiimonas TaxID=288021 RepID=UPI00257E0D3E|nr:class II fumarate hydratase [Kordiimonas sp. UBA4487]
MTDTRQESDSLGTIEVPADRLWGAQTQRCLMNFPIGTDMMPVPFVRALGLQKKAAALANKDLGLLDAKLADAIAVAAGEVAEGKHDAEFPLPVWQTGSGTQSNMNANEVIANRASEMLGGTRGSKEPVHPNDHVNMGQSSNDTIPTVMLVSAVQELEGKLLPALAGMANSVAQFREKFGGVIKLGRTHFQDATPITLGQAFSAYQAQVDAATGALKQQLPRLSQLPQGGTAVGTGLNCHPDFASGFCDYLSSLSGLPFSPAANKFVGISAHDELVALSGVLNGAAAALMKIAGDIRLMGSGPRGGLAELILPKNEPGSSIMAGKVNPTQVEALTMVCAQVMGNHTTVTIAGSQGQLELNAYKPVIIFNVLQSIRLLADATASFTARCLDGLKPDPDRIDTLLKSSLMLATSLVPHIGYDKTAEIARLANDEKLLLKEAALKLGYVTEEDFDRWTDPSQMTHPSDS